jgi:hypothetical protein
MSAWPVSFSARTAPLPKPAAFSCLPSISHIFISGDERSPLMAGFVREIRFGFAASWLTNDSSSLFEVYHDDGEELPVRWGGSGEGERFWGLK